MTHMLRAIAITLLFSACAAAQVGTFNIPPSVTSLRPGFPMSPAPSVTSIAPHHSFGGFGGNIHFNAGVRFGRHPRVKVNFGHFPPPVVVYPYPVFGGYPVYAAPQQPTVVIVERERDAEPPAMTVFERRERSAVPLAEDENDGRYGEGYLDSRRSGNPAPQAQQPPVKAQVIDVVDAPHTVLIFRDGRKLEIANYAIMSGTLINLGDGPRRIQLAELDLDATISANDDRGIAFSVPR